MWEKVSAFWNSLTERQRTLIIVAIVVLVAGIWATYAFLQVDYSGFGGWLQGWAQ